jgi:hypothetical protein
MSARRAQQHGQLKGGTYWRTQRPFCSVSALANVLERQEKKKKNKHKKKKKKTERKEKTKKNGRRQARATSFQAI